MYKHFFKLTALSLIEILITVTIVCILCATSIYTYQDYKIKALYSSALSTVEQNKIIMYSYYSKNKACPPLNFIKQDFNGSQNIASTIISGTSCTPSSTSGTSCTLNLCNSSNAIIMSFPAILTETGDLQYYCTGAASNISKYLSSPCPTTPTPTGNPP